MFDHIRNTTTEETWKSILKDLSDKKTHLEVGFAEKSSLDWSQNFFRNFFTKFTRPKNDWISTVTFLMYLVQNFQQYLDDLKLQLGLAANVDFSGLIIQNFRIKNFQNIQIGRKRNSWSIRKVSYKSFSLFKNLGEFSWSPIHSKRVKLMSRFIFETLYFKLKSFIHLNSFLVFFFTSKIITSLPSTVKFAFMKFHQNMHKRNVISRRTSTGSF